MRRLLLPVGLLAGALLIGACGTDTPTADRDVAAPADGGAAGGACLVGDDDCADNPGLGLTVDEPTLLRTADDLLGTAEDDLTDDVRVSRRGDESFALTEDYVVGRFTVELDEGADGVFEVTTVVVELPDGPTTVER